MATTTEVSTRPTPVAPTPIDETTLIPKKLVRARPLFDPEILRRAVKDSVLKLNPVTLMKNPVIFVVEDGAALVLMFLVRDVATGAGRIGFELRGSARRATPSVAASRCHGRAAAPARSGRSRPA